MNRRDSQASWLASVREMESLGFQVVLAGDHLGDGMSTLPSLVAASLAYPQLRVGTYVIDNDYRHPAVLAMEAATVDQLTGGRLELGIGAGWKKSEYDAAGIAFDPPLVRTQRLCEAVRVIKGLLGPDPLTHRGKFYCIDALDGQPKPLQRPHMPLMIAGGGKRLLEFAAKEADIVAINTRHLHGVVGTGEELLASTFARRVAIVREAAADRWSTLELHLLIKRVVVATDRSAAASQVASPLNLSIEQALDSPYLLLGTVDEMAQQLLAMRDQFGFSYFAVFQQDLRAFGPVLDRLQQVAS